jgi:hypothetical protein
MNPVKYAQMMKYLTRVKKQKPDLPDVFPASKAPIPPVREDVEATEAINAFIRRERQQKAGGGMLVQPGFGGTRQGYKDDNLPDFITKTDSGYRVRSKKTKTNPAVSKSFKKLKDAKAFVREKNLVKSKTGLEFPELVAKAQGVVDDYNNLLDKAVANNDLRNVKFFERYVKDRFKNTSEQNQILRQVYKKKLNYKDLTDARSTVADNLIAEVMKEEKIISQDAIYERLGGKSGLVKSGIVKKISKGLKDQTKIKVNNAVAAIVEADEIIDDSFIKTVANRIGRTQFGSSRGEAAWRKALNKNKFYKENKELLGYAFSAGGKSTRAPGMSLSEILDDAKYKKGGGVTFSGKQTQFSGLRRYIFDYAKQHWHRNNFDGNPEKSLIEFYDKNGKPIKWKAGSKLKLSEVQFKIPSESNIMWSYNGAEAGGPKGSVAVTGKIADRSGIFNEVSETYKVLKDISDAEVTHPVTGQKTTYNKLVSDIYKKGYGYQGKNVFGLDIDHFKGVRDHPFKNLRAMDKRLNISLGAIDKNFDNRNLKSKLKREILGKLATTTGSNYNQALKNYFIGQATNVLDRGITKTLSASDRLAAKSPYYSAIKNVYEQKNLPKVQKELLEKSYGRAMKLVASLGGGDCGRLGKYQGGRIGFQDGTTNVEVCYDKATKRINSGFKNATPAEARNYTKLLNVVKGSAVIGRNLLKFGIVPEALYVGADSLVRMGFGDTFKEAGLRASDFFIPGDQMQEADKLKVQRTLGDAAATNVGKVFDYRNQIANIDSLEQQKANLENLSDVGEFDYIGDLSQDVKNIDTRLNQAKNDLQNKFMVSEAETVAADRALEEAYDISKAKSPLARLKSFAQNIEAVQDDPFLSDIATPQKTQEELNLDMFPTMPRDFLTEKTSDLLDRTQALKQSGYDVSTRDLMAEQKRLRSIPLSQDVITYGPEQMYGAQGTFFGQPLAGGGIAKLAGVSSGPPPESGPNSQGLQGLMKRVRNL